MPQPLTRPNAPIDWSIEVVSNHPVLTSGVGACITAFASTEALMGVFLAMIRWEDAPQDVELWAKEHPARGKVTLLIRQAGLTSAAHQKIATRALDQYLGLSKRRSKLAHGFFGVITDRENEFAWREGGAAARMTASGLASKSWQRDPRPPTLVYKPQDFQSLASDCAFVFTHLSDLLKLLPLVKGFSD